MTPYFGDFAEDATIRIPFNTFDSNDPSASVTITNLVAADIKVHKDGSLTQIVTDGATVVIDFDSITGNHMITIDSSAHADYTTGSDYAVRIEGTTVDAGTINAFIGSFSIENRYNAAADDLANVTDGLGALKALIDTLTTNLATVDGIVDNILVDTGTTLDGKINTIDTNVDAVLLDTGTTLDGKINTIDTNVDAVLLDTGTTIPATIATAQADLDIITDTDGVILGAAGVDLIWDEPIAGHLTAGTQGLSDVLGGVAINDTTFTGTPTSTTAVLTAGSTVDGFYNDQSLYIISGTGVGQVRVISDYVGSTKTCTFDEAFAVTPVSGDRVCVILSHVHTVNSIQEGLATAAALATVDTVVDAIRVPTDKMVFTKANELDVNTKSINDAEVVGDGNATPWDGI